MRYFYYHVLWKVPFRPSFFILAAVFLAVAWFGGYQYDRAEYMASRDPLTGAFNRRSLISHFGRLAGRGNKKFAVILFDLDDFKEINDRFGHEAGDSVLRTFSEDLRSFIGGRGIVARWGGDEFLAVIRDPEGNFRERFTDEMMKSIHSLSCEGGRSIGVSFGMAVYPDDGHDLETLVDAADRSMYRDKLAGK